MQDDHSQQSQHPATDHRGLRVWLERRFAGDDLVHETLSLQKMSDADRIKLERHYRVETIEFVPATGAARDAERVAYLLAYGRPMKWFDDDDREVYRYAHINKWATTPLEAVDLAIEANPAWRETYETARAPRQQS